MALHEAYKNDSVMSDADPISETIHRIQVYVYPRRLRVKEFFVHFDPLRSGRVTLPHFSRCLDQIGVRLSEKECLDLAEHFTQAGPGIVEPQVVSYDAFCKAVDEVFAEGGPAQVDMSSSPHSTMLETFHHNPVDDEEALMQVLHRVAALCKTRRLVLKECFMDNERAPISSPSRHYPMRAGKVTRSQFLRLFPFTKEFTRQEIEMIADRYRAECGNVHYMVLNNDVAEFINHGEQPFARSDLILRPDDADWAHKHLDPVAKLRAKIVERRIRVIEPFQDFDPLRKGHCTVRQVNTVFTILNIEKELERHEFESLVNTYLRDDGLFCYTAFCADIDAHFTTPGLEKTPLATIEMPDHKTTAPARRNRRSLSQHLQMTVQAVEDKLRHQVRTRNMLIKTMFQDMDKMNKGFITNGQFERVLDMLNFKLKPQEVKTLLAQYCDRGNHNQVNWRDFVKSIDHADADCELAVAQHQQPHVEWTPPNYFDHRGRIRHPAGGIPVAVCP
jgi:Ca2+-binding EF-hand superfamily protein